VVKPQGIQCIQHLTSLLWVRRNTPACAVKHANATPYSKVVQGAACTKYLSNIAAAQLAGYSSNIAQHSCQEQQEMHGRPYLPHAVHAASLTGQLLSLKHSSSARSRSGTWGDTAALSTFSISSAMTAHAASRTAWLLALDWLM
jgi:hypothetical protein